MKDILITTDFSPPSDQASEYGLKIAEKAKAKVTFLHIQYTPVDWVHLVKDEGKNFPQLIKSIKHAQSELAKWENRAKDQGLDVDFKLVFDEGQSKIVTNVTEHDHDFIIMSSRGDAKSGSSFMGNTAQKIIRNATVPVLLIKDLMPKFPMKKIVFASDFEADLKGHFDRVTDFANLMEADIELVYINTPYQFEETATSLKKMEQFMDQCSRDRHCGMNIYNSKNREEGIVEFAKSIDADLIAVTTRGRRGFMNFMSRSITESLALNPDIPILSINLQSEVKEESK